MERHSITESKTPQLEGIDPELDDSCLPFHWKRGRTSGIGAYDFYDGIQVLENGEIFIFGMGGNCPAFSR